MTNRMFQFACISFFLNSCTFFGLYQNAFQSSIELLNKKDFTITADIKNLPYAMLLVESESQEILMVLAEVENDELYWVDSENKGFTTLDGKIISTNGFENDIKVFNPPRIKNIFWKLKEFPDLSIKFNSFIRFFNPDTSLIVVNHTFTIKSDHKSFIRKLDNKSVDYYLIEELVQVSSINWSYSNFYWVSKSGNILKSKQEVTPYNKKVFFEILKPYSP